MNIADLNKIDIKNIDLKKIQEDLLQKPELMAALGIVLVSAFLAFHVVSGRINEAKSLKNTVAQLEKKVAAIKTNEAAQKELQELLNSLPNGIPEDNLIDNLTDFAGKRRIKILSFSPLNTVKKDYYTQTTINLNVTAQDYKDMVRFLNDIESSSYILRIDRWTGFMESEQTEKTPQKSEKKEGAVMAQLEINSINFIK